ncbi:MAG: hypothetical protein J6S33_01790 [Aeriscardovia sp.]|nr:hypothetical protein [Aeriscardovia sp.]
MAGSSARTVRHAEGRQQQQTHRQPLRHPPQHQSLELEDSVAGEQRPEQRFEEPDGADPGDLREHGALRGAVSEQSGLERVQRTAVDGRRQAVASHHPQQQRDEEHDGRRERERVKQTLRLGFDELAEGPFHAEEVPGDEEKDRHMVQEDERDDALRVVWRLGGQMTDDDRQDTDAFGHVDSLDAPFRSRRRRFADRLLL